MNQPVICPACGRPTAKAKAPTLYRYKESGIPNLWLRGGVTETSCPNCKRKTVRIKKEPQLLQVLAMTFLMDARPLTGPEMRFVRGACRLSQAKLAAALEHRRETVAEREAKAKPGIHLSDEMLLRMVLLRNFLAVLNTPGERFLTDAQFERLKEFAGWFVDFAESFVTKMPKQPKVVAAMGEDEDWELDKAA